MIDTMLLRLRCITRVGRQVNLSDTEQKDIITMLVLHHFLVQIYG
jgi:hypothetical protein